MYALIDGRKYRPFWTVTTAVCKRCRTVQSGDADAECLICHDDDGNRLPVAAAVMVAH